MRYFVTAIGTDSGKTLVSALLCEALGAAYWKPIQAGRPTDSDQMRAWLGSDLTIFPENYLLEAAIAPQAAAALEGKSLVLGRIVPPEHENVPLVIEGAGGLLVPLNDKETMIDLLLKCKAAAILVINTYLGCINHGLLTAAMLRARRVPVRGIVFNGESMPESEASILKHSGYQCLLRLPRLQKVHISAMKPYISVLRRALRGLRASDES